MKPVLLAALLALFMGGEHLIAQSAHKSSTPPPATAGANAPDYSGMYTFLKDGEFVQLSVEEDGSVTGFISRYGDESSDSGAFLNQFFKKASLDGQKLMFTTKTVHGVWFEFTGMVQYAGGKNPDEEGSRVIQGSLVEYSTGPGGKQTSKTRQVTFKSFPADVDSNDSQ